MYVQRALLRHSLIPETFQTFNTNFADPTLGPLIQYASAFAC